jgi:hypothetical protein
MKDKDQNQGQKVSDKTTSDAQTSGSTVQGKQPEEPKGNTNGDQQKQKQQKPAAKKPAPAAASKKKPEGLKGNIDSSYVVPKGEEKSVHYRITDLAVPKFGQRLDEEKKPVKRLVKSSAVNFVNAFKMQYEGGGAFINVNTPADIYCILKNINLKVIEKQYEGIIFSATKGNIALKARKVATLLKNKKRLALNGDPSNQIVFVEDILHVPGIEGVNVDEIPKHCIPINQYLEDLED